ncbi:sigma-54 dependent transcriptional regulator [Palleronia sp. LCG004]|uniref:sigma-54-dependent transcriptional regulator n=1 Tax=Palleronia sp. LCG004 TaxID=3079304 RepID=UPI00294214DF|nr:sigma-54 dependent transcriptional regulator [Palleronia sp. LCG004]WOI55815.1 sigma-54 dependent transcriptional regulator [Palleronia sp. LCG004]
MSGDPIFVIDDDEDVRASLAEMLELAGLDPVTFSRAEPALDALRPDFPGIVICDIRMPRMDGMAFLDAALARDRDLPILLVTGHGDVELAVEALGRGAYDFIEKPFARQRLMTAVGRALEKRRMTLDLRDLRGTDADGTLLDEIVLGRAAEIVEIRRKIRTIAESELDVLIVGATGTGKEHVARGIHALGSGMPRPFVAINLAALSVDHVEAELFGYTANAFPGSSRARTGRLEQGRGGTIFLDEVSSAPLALQAKLLRVLEDRAVSPLGAAEAVPLEARFIASSRVPLEPLVEAGQFRDDLLYRLNPVTLRMPDLSERRQDIPRLFVRFVADAARRMERPLPETPPDLLMRMAERDWPGNLRELRSAADLLVLGLEDPPQSGTGSETLTERLERAERDMIASTLAIHDGSLKATYEALGIGRKTLYEKMQKYGIRREDASGRG